MSSVVGPRGPTPPPSLTQNTPAHPVARCSIAACGDKTCPHISAVAGPRTLGDRMPEVKAEEPAPSGRRRGSEPGHKQSCGLFVPGERPGPPAQGTQAAGHPASSGSLRRCPRFYAHDIKAVGQNVSNEPDPDPSPRPLAGRDETHHFDAADAAGGVETAAEAAASGLEAGGTSAASILVAPMCCSIDGKVCAMPLWQSMQV